MVEELRAVVGVDTGDVEREPQLELFEVGGDDPFTLGAHGDDLGPAGGDVGGVQAVVELAVVVPALVPDQVDLRETRDRLVPLVPGLERDRGLQQRSWPGMADAPTGDQPSARTGPAPVDRGR